MLDRIVEKLKALPCEAWEVTQTQEERWEFYFIGKKLDQNRAVRILETEVRVYKKSEDGQFLGSASGVLSPTDSEKDADEMLEKLLWQAGLVKNPVYTLTDTPVTAAPRTDRVDVAGIAKDCMLALADAAENAEDETSSVNSYEIFVSGMDRHTLNSNGVEYRCTYPQTEMEVVVNAREGSHEIELHRIYRSGTCDRDRLEKDIAAVMQYGRDRLHAEPTPKLGRGDVVFSTEDAAEIYEYFAQKMHAELVVRGLSSWKIGEPIAEEMKGDKISVEAVPELTNSSMNYPVDREGSEIYDRWLIRDGIAQNYCGSRQFSQYLGLEKSSLVTNLKFSGGSRSEEEVRSGEYLEVVEFSDFQVDAMSGDIAGEIRLGYWHRDGEVRIVTGGSVSGTMVDAVKDMEFSAETVQYNNLVVPKVTKLKGLRIVGVR